METMEGIGAILRRKMAEKNISSSQDSQSSDSLQDHLERQARWDNETIGHLPGPHCELCNDKGYIAVVRENTIVHRECQCMAERRSMSRIQRSGLKALMEQYTFDAYQTPEPWQKAAKQKALRFLDDHQRKWFVASGVAGSGKTHLCTAICGALMERGMDTRYMLWRSDAIRLKTSITEPEEYEAQMSPLKNSPVLYIDDFFKAGRDERGKLKITAADVNLAFDLLNDRYNDPQKVTILSSELSVEDIMAIDMAVGSRIYERGKEYGLVFQGANKNWRLRQT